MSEPPKYADRSYRSVPGIVGGVLLLALTAWLGADALLRGEGRVPFMSLAVMALVVPLVVAFSVRPAVFANRTRIRVRNPFRTIVAPWSRVDAIRAGYSCELIADGAKYQLWAIPVSLRARSRANRHNRRLAAGEAPSRGPFGVGGRTAEDAQERTAASDAAVRELRELADDYQRDAARPRRGTSTPQAGPQDATPEGDITRDAAGDAAVPATRRPADGPQGTASGDGQGAGDGVTVVWAYELIVPAALGAVGVLVLWFSA